MAAWQFMNHLLEFNPDSSALLVARLRFSTLLSLAARHLLLSTWNRGPNPIFHPSDKIDNPSISTDFRPFSKFLL